MGGWAAGRGAVGVQVRWVGRGAGSGGSGRGHGAGQGSGQTRAVAAVGAQSGPSAQQGLCVQVLRLGVGGGWVTWVVHWAGRGEPDGGRVGWLA